MKAQVKTPVLIAVAVVLLGGIGYWGMQTISNTGSLDHGQIKYTPGKPPGFDADAKNQGRGAAPAIDNRPQH